MVLGNALKICAWLVFLNIPYAAVSERFPGYVMAILGLGKLIQAFRLQTQLLLAGRAHWRKYRDGSGGPTRLFSEYVGYRYLRTYHLASPAPISYRISWC